MHGNGPAGIGFVTNQKVPDGRRSELISIAGCRCDLLHTQSLVGENDGQPDGENSPACPSRRPRVTGSGVPPRRHTVTAMKPEVPEPVGDLRVLREHAGARSRTVDEHMFTVGRSSCRLQLFTGPGLRPVAVATQTDREGASLMNRAERFIEAVWERLCPGEVQPPIFIAHHLRQGEDLRFSHYGFTAIGPHTVARPPTWGPRLRPAELAVLVSGPVDEARGDGYVEPVPPDEPWMRYAVAALIRLPRPDLEGEPACMPAGTPWRRRLFRQVVPRRSGLSCCSYHRVDWAEASAAAVTALARADSGEPEQDPDDEQDDPEDERMFGALQALRSAGLDEVTRRAAESLFLDPIQPEAADGVVPYINGRHRVQAMLDAGVRRTVVGRWEEPGGDR